MAPVHAVPRLLDRNDLTLEDFDYYEIHEAFSGQVLCTWQLCIRTINYYPPLQRFTSLNSGVFVVCDLPPFLRRHQVVQQQSHRKGEPLARGIHRINRHLRQVAISVAVLSIDRPRSHF